MQKEQTARQSLLFDADAMRLHMDDQIAIAMKMIEETRKMIASAVTMRQEAERRKTIA